MISRIGEYEMQTFGDDIMDAVHKIPGSEIKKINFDDVIINNTHNPIYKPDGLFY